MEPGNSWGRGEGWAKVMELIEIAKRTEYKVSPERRERILQRALASVEAERRRNVEPPPERGAGIFARMVARAAPALRLRSMWGAFAAGASTVLLVGALLRLIGAGAPPGPRCSPELAAKAPSAHVATE